MLWLAKRADFCADRRTSSPPEPLLPYRDERIVHPTSRTPGRTQVDSIAAPVGTGETRDRRWNGGEVDVLVAGRGPAAALEGAPGLARP
jgi:hypothetical protein